MNRRSSRTLLSLAIILATLTVAILLSIRKSKREALP